MDCLINRILAGFLPVLVWAQLEAPYQLHFIDEQQLTDEELYALESYFEHPLNLNTVTPLELWFLDDSLSAIILKVRETNPYHSWQDLAQRTKLPETMIQEMKMIFYLPPRERYHGDWSTRITTDGEDERIRTRLNVISGAWVAQWILQRDPKEYDLTDLSAFSFKFQHGSATFLLGSHRLDWGSGLLMSKVYSPSRGPVLLCTTSEIMRIRPGYSSMNTGVIRGISLGIQLDKVKLFAGTGFHKTDVRLTSDGLPRIVPYRNHSRPSNQQYELLPWMGVCTSLRNTKLGLFAGEQSLLANNALPGSRKLVQSIALTHNRDVQTGKWQLQYEEAWQTRFGTSSHSGPLRATQAKLVFHSHTDSSGNRIRLAVIYRAYPYAWMPIRGQLFGRHISNGNERGLYVGWQWSKHPISLYGHLDTFEQILSDDAGLWPQKGWESGLAARLNTNTGSMRFSYQHREEEVNISTENSKGLIINSWTSNATHYASITCTGNLSDQLSVRIQAVHSRMRHANETGTGNAIGSTLGYQSRQKANLSAGVHIYRTDGWEERIIIYEKGLPSEFNLKFLSGSGVRFHICMAIPMAKGTISVRGAKDCQTGTQAVQSEADHLDLGFQFDIAL